MNKSILMLAIAGSAMMAMTSCNKTETPISKTESATVSSNQVYTYTLPATDDPWSITNEADHGNLSKIGNDSLGNAIYLYTPVANYTGTDQVVLATTDVEIAKKPHQKDSTECGKHAGGTHLEDDYIVTLNFNVIPN